MIILTEENKELKGTTYKLPNKIRRIFANIVMNYGAYASYPGYVRAKNVFTGDGYVTMEWLKNMKHYFTKYPKGIEFRLGGGDYVREFVDSKLRLLTGHDRAEHTNDPTKPYQGGKTHKSKNSSLGSLSFKMENKNKKLFIVTEEQINKIKNL